MCCLCDVLCCIARNGVMCGDVLCVVLTQGKIQCFTLQHEMKKVASQTKVKVGVRRIYEIR